MTEWCCGFYLTVCWCIFGIKIDFLKIQHKAYPLSKKLFPTRKTDIVFHFMYEKTPPKFDRVFVSPDIHLYSVMRKGHNTPLKTQ